MSPPVTPQRVPGRVVPPAAAVQEVATWPERPARPAASNGPSPRPLGWLLTVGGLIGLAAAFVLLVEKIRLLQDPAYVPSCSLNPVLSCGSVMVTPQAEALGFPNPMIGLISFAAVATVGVGVLSGAAFPRWFWLGLQAGTTAGAAFVHWLIFQSLYRIEALCPYCMVVWAVTIPIFWYTTLHTLRQHTGARGRALGRRLAGGHAVVLTAWFLVVLALITVQFWTYWSTLLT